MADPVPNWRSLPAISEEEQPVFADDWTPSQTFLRTQDNCDRASLLYLQYRGGASSVELNRGAIQHETIDALLRIMRKEGERKMAPEIGRDVLYEVMSENAHMQVSAKERDALRYMTNHWCRGFEVDPTKIIGIEKTLTLEIGGFRVLVRPDLIVDGGDGVLEIIDWKTAWPPDSQEFVAQAYDMEGNPRWAGNYQLNMSAVVAAYGISDDGMSLGKFDRYKLRLLYPRILRKEGTRKFLDERWIEVDNLQVLSFRDDLELQLRRLREVCMGERKWQPTPGSHCQTCTAEAACPLPRYLRPESQMASLDTVEDLQEAGTKWLFMSKSASRLKGRLKSVAEGLPEDDITLPDGQKGVMIGEDLALVFVESETKKIKDRERLLAAAQEAYDLGVKFDRDQHIDVQRSVKFEKRKVRT